jgi:hypothetical protein
MDTPWLAAGKFILFLCALASLREVLIDGAKRHHYSMFSVGRSTCPQCLENGMRPI